jgi:hypothetical protein
MTNENSSYIQFYPVNFTVSQIENRPAFCVKCPEANSKQNIWKEEMNEHYTISKSVWFVFSFLVDIYCAPFMKQFKI